MSGAYWALYASSGYGISGTEALWVVGHGDVGYPADIVDHVFRGYDGDGNLAWDSDAIFHPGDFCWPDDSGVTYAQASAHGLRILQEVRAFAGKFLPQTDDSIDGTGGYSTHIPADIGTGFLGQTNFWYVGTPVHIPPPLPGTPISGSSPYAPPPGGAGPSSDPGPPNSTKAPKPPTKPTGVPIPAPGPIGDESISLPPTVTASDVINDLPAGDIVETPVDSGGGDISSSSGPGGNPDGGTLVTWQPVLKPGIDRPNCIFGWGVPPRNVKAMKILDDGQPTVNMVTGTGGAPPAPYMHFKGEYDSGAPLYITGDYVTLSGVLYRCIEPGAPHSPLTFYFGNPYGNHAWWAIETPYAGDWSASFGNYPYRCYVIDGSALYLCTIPHASSSGKEPGTAGGALYWGAIDPTGPAQLMYTATDMQSIKDIGLYWATVDFPEATSMVTLTDMVNAYLKKNRRGNWIITFDPAAGAESLPKPWAEFGLADTVRVHCSWKLRGGIPKGITGPYGLPLDHQLVNGWDIEIDDNTDAETLTKLYTEEDLG